ncbi:MAG: four-helix bundle copper-binding protein [Peptococcaceae bacterium]
MPLDNLLPTLRHCTANCLRMTTMIGGYPDAQCRFRQQQLLMDCADICDLTSRFVARGSYFARPAVQLCADICAACACECAGYPDQHSQHCAMVCMQCAQECRAFAMMCQ